MQPANLPQGVSGTVTDTNYAVPATNPNPGQTEGGFYSGKTTTPGIGGAIVNNTVTQTGLPANTTINSTNTTPSNPVTVPNTQTSVAPINPTVSTPTGTTIGTNGLAMVTPVDKNSQNRSDITSLIDQLSGKASVTSDLQKQYQLDTKTQVATDSYNAYQKAKIASDQQIQGIYGNPNLTRDQANQQVQEIQRINNANLANLSVQANADAGNLTAAQAIIKSKIDAQFQPIQDQIDNKMKFLQLNNADLTDSEKTKLQAQIEQQKLDKTATLDATKDIHDRLLQNNAPTSVYSTIDGIQQKYANGQITSQDAINQMYQAAGSYGSTNKFLSVNAGYDPKTGQPIQRIFDTVHGRFVDGQPGPNPTPTNTTPVGYDSSNPSPVTPATGLVNKNGAQFALYGNLAKTDFNPNDDYDSKAYNYLTNYLNNGSIPTPSSLGIKGPGSSASITFTNIQRRALGLYFAATGQPLPSPAIIANNIKLINTNNDLGNKLVTQEQTVKANVDLSLANMTKAGLNSNSFGPLNSLIDTTKALFNDPDVGQFLSQNATIQNELGSLLAVKNASGTTVFDKLQSAGIISSSDTPEVIQRKVNTIIQEAGNFSTAISKVNGELYKKIDPLMINPDNPNRQAAISASTTDQYKSQRSQLKTGEILIERNGQIGAIPVAEILPTDKKL